MEILGAIAMAILTAIAIVAMATVYCLIRCGSDSDKPVEK